MTSVAKGSHDQFTVTHRAVLAIAVPMTIGFITTPLLGLTDTAVVGQSGRAADLGGLAVAAVIFDLIFSLIGFTRTSTTAFVAQAFGRGDRAEESAVFYRATAIGITAGLLVILFSPLILKIGLVAIAPPEGSAAVAATYFYIRVLSSPIHLINGALLGYVLGRAQGRLALLLQLITNGANIILSVALGLWAAYGVSGVAWGTVLAEVIGAGFGLVLIWPTLKQSSKPELRSIFTRQKLMKLMAVNRDIMIRSLLLVGSFVILARFGSKLGPVPLAANGLLMNLFMVAAFFLDGMAAAAEQLAGRALGAFDRLAFNRTVRLTAIWSFALSALLAVFFLTAGKPAIAFLTTAEDVRAMAGNFLPWMALTAITGALAFQMDGIYLGTAWSKEMRNMMVISFIGYCLAIWGLTPFMGNHGIWAALNLFLALRGITLALLLPRKSRQMFRDAQ